MRESWQVHHWVLRRCTKVCTFFVKLSTVLQTRPPFGWFKARPQIKLWIQVWGFGTCLVFYGCLEIKDPLRHLRPLRFIFFPEGGGGDAILVIYTECKYGGPLGRRPGRVMKVRLVRPRCFVLTILPWKVLLRGRASLFYFAMPTSFCVLEC